MAHTIFYSWQSDTTSNTNRAFIKDAIERAIQRIAQDMSVEEAIREEPLQLDQDIQDIPGNPEIANTILQKIDTCGIFVPDLTCVARTEKGKCTPNPNVLLELGYAMKSIGSTRIVSVMNEAFGKAEGGLPFDLAHRRWPIRYTLPVGASPETKKKVREDFVTTLISAIRTILESGVLRSEPQQPVFHETPSVWKSSSFLQDGALVATCTVRQRGLTRVVRAPLDVLWQNEPQAFLRLIPTSSTSTRLPVDLLKLIIEHKLVPFGFVGGSTKERNEYGAVVFQKENSVHHISQVFKNGELWGISKLSEISEEWWPGNQAFIPSTYVEEEFERMLESYLQFAHEKLKLPLPLRLIAGLSDVKGFQMIVPGSAARGNVIEDEIIHKGTINIYTTPVQEYLRPFFDLIWKECGLERPSNFRN